MKADLKKLEKRKGTIKDSDLCKQFSVFVPIVEEREEYSLLFEVRSEKLNRQPNEICFPGGSIEPYENNARAAIRETSEELLIPEKNIVLLGELDTFVTPFNTIIYPYVGKLTDYRNTFSRDEVKETFTVPLSMLMDIKPICHYIDVRLTPGEDFPYQMIQQGMEYPWRSGKYPVYFYVCNHKIIWGITARIIKNLTDILKGE